MLNFDNLPAKVVIPADLAAVLYDVIKEQKEWTGLDFMREELKSQTVTMPPEMVVWIFARLQEGKEMNVMTELYRVLKGQGA